jgi:xanthine dehydrogenase YagR molybdenum-binding subunit
MAGTSHAYRDDVAPEGSPFRPLYDAKIVFSGQPIALVLAEEWEIARFAASLVRVEYETEAHVTDPYAQRDQPSLSKSRSGCAATRRAHMRRPTPATRPNTTSR